MPDSSARRILLATDLDRDALPAFERTLQLREAWAAEVTLLHVREAVDTGLGGEAPATDSERLSVLRRRLNEVSLAGPGEVGVRLLDGDAAARIDEVAQAEGCDLIVMGPAHREAFSWLDLGETLDRTLRRVTVPVLLVRRSVAGAYRHAVFATDLSEDNQASFVRATALFPQLKQTLLHAFEAPMAGLVDKPQEYAADEAQAAGAALERFAANLPPVGGERALAVRHGASARVLCDEVAASGADLAILTASPRGAVAEFFLGSVVKSALECLESDVLILPKRMT